MFLAAALKSETMMKWPPTLPISAALIAALLLSSCGKQEAVGDVPSNEELAKQADAASQAIRDEAAALDDSQSGAVIDSADMSSYTNALRGFTIMVPNEWAVDSSASDDNGQVFRNAALGLTLQVGWVENREDAAWNAELKAVEDAGDTMSGEAVNENEYRASGTLANGTGSAQRMLRNADGTMIRAIISFDAEQSDAIQPLATTVLDSLTLQQ